ncbi:MAG: hypothetical protein ACK4V2_07385 [Pseudomonadota bacterium]|jgi:hypothetical protein|nr:hypothetical protein [Alphaproteobacteria bacterium]
MKKIYNLFLLTFIAIRFIEGTDAGVSGFSPTLPPSSLSAENTDLPYRLISGASSASLLLPAETIENSYLEQIEAIAEGRRAYNESLLEFIENEEFLIQHRIGHCSQLIGMDLSFSDHPSMHLQTFIKSIRNDLDVYKFLIKGIHEIEANDNYNSRQKRLIILFGIMSCKEEIEKQTQKELAYKNNDCYEQFYFTEIKELLKKSTIIPPAYISFSKRLRLDLRDGEVKLGIELPSDSNCKLTLADLAKKIKIFEKYRKNRIAYNINEDDLNIDQLLQGIVATQLRIINESKNLLLSKSSAVTLTFAPIENSVEFMAEIPELFYNLHYCYITASSVFKEAQTIYQDLIEKAEAFKKKINDEKAAERIRRYEKFKAEQKHLAEEARIRAEQRRIADEEQQKIERERVYSPEKEAATVAVEELKEEARIQIPAHQKVKTKGIAKKLEHTHAAGSTEAASSADETSSLIIPKHIQEFVRTVIEADFGTMENLFKDEIGATVELRDNNKRVISFHSPVNGKLVKFYVDTPHGAQLEKFRTAWREQMIKALVRADMKLR